MLIDIRLEDNFCHFAVSLLPVFFLMCTLIITLCVYYWMQINMYSFIYSFFISSVIKASSSRFWSVLDLKSTDWQNIYLILLLAVILTQSRFGQYWKISQPCDLLCFTKSEKWLGCLMSSQNVCEYTL